MTAVTNPPVSPLTGQQRRVLEYIAGYFAEFAQAPAIRAIREICDHMGISSPNGVVGHLLALVQKGYLERDRKDAAAGVRARSRCLRIVGLADLIAPVVRRHLKALLKEGDRAAGD